jgi:predicted nucleic-acid-binding Zn-ribbon protein
MSDNDDWPLVQLSGSEVLELFLKKLREVRGNEDVSCPICNHDDWTVAELGEVRMYEPGRLSSQILPVVPISCDTCGYTMFFNAVTLGVERQEPADSDKTVPPETAEES